MTLFDRLTFLDTFRVSNLWLSISELAVRQSASVGLGPADVVLQQKDVLVRTSRRSFHIDLYFVICLILFSNILKI